MADTGKNPSLETKAKKLVLVIGLIIFGFGYLMYFLFTSLQVDLGVTFAGFFMLGGLLTSLVGYFLWMKSRLRAAKQASLAAGQKGSGKTFLPYGFLLAFCGYIINTSFMVLGVVGYLRELTRLTTIIGIIMVLVGFAQLILLGGKKASAKKRAFSAEVEKSVDSYRQACDKIHY